MSDHNYSYWGQHWYYIRKWIGDTPVIKCSCQGTVRMLGHV